MHDLIEHATDASVLLDSDARVLYANAAARGLGFTVDHPAQDVIGAELTGLASKRLGARRRRTASATAFVARGRVDRARVLLVDDVMTTGATASACADVLKERGATEVRVAVWARTPPSTPIPVGRHPRRRRPTERGPP